MSYFPSTFSHCTYFSSKYFRKCSQPWRSLLREIASRALFDLSFLYLSFTRDNPSIFGNNGNRVREVMRNKSRMSNINADNNNNNNNVQNVTKENIVNRPKYINDWTSGRGGNKDGRPWRLPKQDFDLPLKKSVRNSLEKKNQTVNR